MSGSMAVKRAHIYEHTRGLAFQKIRSQWQGVMGRGRRMLEEGKKAQVWIRDEAAVIAGIACQPAARLIFEFSDGGREKRIIPSPEGLCFIDGDTVREVIPYHPKHGLAFWFLMPTLELHVLSFPFGGGERGLEGFSEPPEKRIDFGKVRRDLYHGATFGRVMGEGVEGATLFNADAHHDLGAEHVSISVHHLGFITEGADIRAMFNLFMGEKGSHGQIKISWDFAVMLMMMKAVSRYVWIRPTWYDYEVDAPMQLDYYVLLPEQVPSLYKFVEDKLGEGQSPFYIKPVTRLFTTEFVSSPLIAEFVSSTCHGNNPFVPVDVHVVSPAQIPVFEAPRIFTLDYDYLFNRDFRGGSEADIARAEKICQQRFWELLHALAERDLSFQMTTLSQTVDVVEPDVVRRIDQMVDAVRRT